MDEQFALEQVEPELEDAEGEIIARSHEIARWRETAEVAYERDFAVRLTFDDERIVKISGDAGERLSGWLRTRFVERVQIAHEMTICT